MSIFRRPIRGRFTICPSGSIMKIEAISLPGTLWQRLTLGALNISVAQETEQCFQSWKSSWYTKKWVQFNLLDGYFFTAMLVEGDLLVIFEGLWIVITVIRWKRTVWVAIGPPESWMFVRRINSSLSFFRSERSPCGKHTNFKPEIDAL